ncbi:MAG: Tfp pilus assembly protein FimT/FimU [Dehalococcoidia bacterium]
MLMSRNKQRGFALVEMMVVVLITVILTAIAIPNLLDAIRRYQLESSVRSAANTLLVARYEAIRRNQLATTIYREVPAPPVYGIDTNGNLSLDADESIFPLSQNVRITNVGAPALTTMGPNYDCAPACPAQPNKSPFGVNFSPRGTAMQQLTSGPQNYWIEATAVYVVFVQHQIDGDWAAVTITPAGRTRVWFWNGTSWVF